MIYLFAELKSQEHSGRRDESVLYLPSMMPFSLPYRAKWTGDFTLLIASSGKQQVTHLKKATTSMPGLSLLSNQLRHSKRKARFAAMKSAGGSIFFAVEAIFIPPPFLLAGNGKR